MFLLVKNRNNSNLTNTSIVKKIKANKKYPSKTNVEKRIKLMLKLNTDIFIVSFENNTKRPNIIIIKAKKL